MPEGAQKRNEEMIRRTTAEEKSQEVEAAQENPDEGGIGGTAPDTTGRKIQETAEHVSEEGRLIQQEAARRSVEYPNQAPSTKGERRDTHGSRKEGA